MERAVPNTSTRCPSHCCILYHIRAAENNDQGIGTQVKPWGRTTDMADSTYGWGNGPHLVCDIGQPP